MKKNRSKPKLNFSILTFSTLALCFPSLSEAMLARSILHDAVTVFSRSIGPIHAEHIISRSFSRYAKFDGENDAVYIPRVQKLRDTDNEAWRNACALRADYNNDWDAFQEKYFPKQKVIDNSCEITDYPVSYPGRGGSSHTSDTNGFLKGWLANDINSAIFGSKAKMNPETSHNSSINTAPSSDNSSYSRENSSYKSSSSCTSSESSGGGDSSDWGSSDDGGDFDD